MFFTKPTLYSCLKPKHKLIAGLVIALIALVSIGSVVYAWSDYSSDSHDGSVNGVDWTASSYLWGYSSGNLFYSGESISQTEGYEVIDSVGAHTEGRIYCGSAIYYQQDWWEETYNEPGWIAGANDQSGPIFPALCDVFAYPLDYIEFVNYNNHNVEDSYDSDSHSFDTVSFPYYN